MIKHDYFYMIGQSDRQDQSTFLFVLRALAGESGKILCFSAVLHLADLLSNFPNLI